jgi:hypothetical protein
VGGREGGRRGGEEGGERIGGKGKPLLHETGGKKESGESVDKAGGDVMFQKEEAPPKFDSRLPPSLPSLPPYLHELDVDPLKSMRSQEIEAYVHPRVSSGHFPEGAGAVGVLLGR